jgi:hypothetical protein
VQFSKPSERGILSKCKCCRFKIAIASIEMIVFMEHKFAITHAHLDNSHNFLYILVLRLRIYKKYSCVDFC